MKKTILDVDLKGKRVLMRVDFNVPINNGIVTDTTRITAAIPTIKSILDQGASAVILMSHLGRPKGSPDPKYSLKPVAPVLASLMGLDVHFVEDCIGPVAEEAVRALPDGGVLMLENTRFHPEEEKNDPGMGQKLAALGDIYVNDAFGSAHRAHASTEGVAHYLPAVAGLLMDKEITFLGSVLESPKHPFVAILGGAKISDKIGVIENLLNKADHILIGGGMANTFFAAQGIAMGDSLVEGDALDTAKTLLGKAAGKLVLPQDAVIADAFDVNASTQTISTSAGVPVGWRILDIGPETVKQFAVVLGSAKTILWNGPMGVFEMKPFAQGTFAVAQAVADQTKQGAVSIIGGGDSAAAIHEAGLEKAVTHVSTGGGASLEMLEGLPLPGLAALNEE